MERTLALVRQALVVVIAALLVARPTAAQEQVRSAELADAGSLNAIIAAVYDVISGPVGEARDWDRFYSLFIPEARLVATGRGAGGQAGYRAMTPAEYVESNGDGLTNVGFIESEIARTVETFGNVSHVFSTYESKFTQNGQPATARGINSIQLYNDGARWWIVTIFWDSERPDNPIPAKYLPGGGR
jgi:hypothetical protein